MWHHAEPATTSAVDMLYSIQAIVFTHVMKERIVAIVVAIMMTQKAFGVLTSIKLGVSARNILSESRIVAAWIIGFVYLLLEEVQGA